MTTRKRTKAPVMEVLSETLGPSFEQELDAPLIIDKVRFVKVPTAELLKLDHDDGRDVKGSFVKLAPRLRRSEREAFDTGAAERALLDRGAVAAVAVPVVIPDQVVQKVVSSARSVDAHAEITAWFGEAPVGDAMAALDRCLHILDEVGL